MKYWAKEENLYHSSGTMYCYSWIIYAINLVLPQLSAARTPPRLGRPYTLPETSRRVLLTTIELRLWMYFDPIDIRNVGNILSVHGALIHFLSAAEDFDVALCTNTKCKCKIVDGCFPNKDGKKIKRTSVFGGASGGGVYFAGCRALMLLLRLTGAIPALCETSESFFKLLKAMLRCTNKQWDNILHKVKNKINGTKVERITNMTEKMKEDRRLKNQISIGTTNLMTSGCIPWKLNVRNPNNIEILDGVKYTFSAKIVHSMSYILVWMHVADYWLFQYNDGTNRWSTCNVEDGSVTWYGNVNNDSALLLDVRTTSPPEMNVIKKSCLQRLVQVAHLLVVDGFNKNQPGGLYFMIKEINKELVKNTAAAPGIKKWCLDSGMEEVDGSNKVQLPDCSRIPIEAAIRAEKDAALAAQAALRLLRRNALIGDGMAGEALEKALADEMEDVVDSESDSGDDLVNGGNDGIGNNGHGGGEDDEEELASACVVGENEFDGWNLNDLIENEKVFYMLDHVDEDETFQVKVLKFSSVLRRPIILAWALNVDGLQEDKAKALLDGDTTSYTLTDFKKYARPKFLQQHTEWLDELHTYGKKQFEIEYPVDEHRSEQYKATIKEIDTRGHTVTITYVIDKTDETVGIQTFFDRLKVRPKKKKRKNPSSSSSSSSNQFRKTYKPTGQTHSTSNRSRRHGR